MYSRLISPEQSMEQAYTVVDSSYWTPASFASYTQDTSKYNSTADTKGHWATPKPEPAQISYQEATSKSPSNISLFLLIQQTAGGHMSTTTHGIHRSSFPEYNSMRVVTTAKRHVVPTSSPSPQFLTINSLRVMTWTVPTHLKCITASHLHPSISATFTGVKHKALRIKFKSTSKSKHQGYTFQQIVRHWKDLMNIKNIAIDWHRKKGNATTNEEIVER